MLKNYLKVALRNILRHKTYSLINLAGLAIGMAMCLLIYQYVTYELSYDSFHANGDNIYRIVPAIQNDSGEWRKHAMTPMPLGPLVAEDYPEVVAYTRFGNSSEAIVKVGADCHIEQLLYADPDMLSMFSFPLAAGNRSTALQDISSIVITESMAIKHFGETDVVGEVVSIKLGGEFREFAVTAVAKDVPANSTIEFDFVLPYQVIVDLWGPPFTTSWGAMVTRTFVQLADGSNPAVLADRLTELAIEKNGESEGGLAGIRVEMQPLKGIHLDPSVTSRFEPTTNPLYLYILTGIALALLIVACFNFTNISIGLASVRLKEVGVRKVLGAARAKLAQQYLTESGLLALLSLIAAVALAELMLPVFNVLANARLQSGELLNWVSLPAMLILLMVTAVLSGAYPALFLSRMHPSQILKGSMRIGGSNLFTRSLIIVQFAVSVFFVVCTLYMSKQMDHVRSTELGFNGDQVLVFPVSSREGSAALERLKNTVGTYGSVTSIAGTRELLGRENDFALVRCESEGLESQTFLFGFDEDVVPTLDMEIVEGRNLSREHASDPGRAVLVNEAFVEERGWESPIGKRLKISFPGFVDEASEIVGVVKDFHYLSLHTPIRPAVIYKPAEFKPEKLLVRVASNDISSVLAVVGDQWNQIAPNQPFRYYFLDEEFRAQYRSDEKWQQIIIYSAVLTILISGIGLLGVTTMTLNRRTKEIGIRKVLGASVSGLVSSINREFAVLILIANAVSWPVAYFVMNRWLENFAYRADVGWTVYVLAALLAALVALITTSVQALRAARANPVDSLRYE